MKKVAIVTGASKGIGAATAKLLAERGYAVAVKYYSDDVAAEEVVKAIKKKDVEAIAVKADIGTEEGIAYLFKTVDKWIAERKLGPVAALVNNAAVGPTGTVEQMTWREVEQVFSVNVIGMFAACREAVKRMKEADGGAIVNISSEAGRFGGNRMAHYAASKAAVNTFTMAFAREAAAYNVRVNAVSPGVINTGVHDAATQERRDALLKSIPMGRMGKPEEVAEAIAWLISDAASYVSGSILTIAGAR